MHKISYEHRILPRRKTPNWLPLGAGVVGVKNHFKKPSSIPPPSHGLHLPQISFHLGAINILLTFTIKRSFSI